MSEEREPSTSRKRPWRMMIGLTIMVGGFYVMANSAVEGGVYYLTVDEAMSAPPPDRPIQIKGDVIVGTYKNPAGTKIHDFDIRDKKGAKVVSIHFDGPLPDVFKEGAEVVATGRLDANGVLTATEVTAKCPSKYEEGKMTEQAKEKAGLKPES